MARFDPAWIEMESPTDIALEFCRKCLLWPYADISPAWPNLIFEDLDPAIKANTFDFTDTDEVMAVAIRWLPRECFLVLWAPAERLFAAMVEDRSAQPPKTLSDHPVQDFDIRLAIMGACVEAWYMLRKQRD